VPEDRYLYWQFEEDGLDQTIPVINKKKMCRNGCCTTCAMKVVGYEKGGSNENAKFKMEGSLGLLKDLRQEGWILSCCTLPKSDLRLELQEEDEVYVRQWSEGFEGGGVEWGGFLPEDD
jgi:ferredoxin